MRAAAVLFAALALAAPAGAQETSVVGTAVIGGKKVELLSDRSWRFAEVGAAQGTCVPINLTLSFCGSILDWKPIPTTGSEFTRLFRHDSRTYAGVIYEEVGREDGMDAEFMRNVVIENAAAATGIPPAEIPIHDVQDKALDGIPAETIAYGASINGLDVVYMNTILNGPRHTVQLVSWTIGADLTDQTREAHRGFTEGFDFPQPELLQ